MAFGKLKKGSGTCPLNLKYNIRTHYTYMFTYIIHSIQSYMYEL